MYNFTDTNPKLFNLKDEPFWGMLVFVKPGTSKTYVNVTDVDGNNLGHIVTTNQYGRLQTQIFLDCTVDVQMWEYTGTQFDVEDLTQFTLIRTERILDPAENIKLSVEGVQTVNSMTELRALDTSGYDQYTVVYRMGYYRGGDHEPLAYYWDATMSGNDDGGYIVRPSGVTGNGRWIAIFPDHIDIRWYGVQGADLQSQVLYQSSAMLAAINRSKIMGKTLYFPADSVSTYYGLDNVAVNVAEADIRMDAGVRLVGKANTTNSITCYNLYCDRDSVCLITSQSSDSFNVTCHEFWTASISGNNMGEINADIVHLNANIRQNYWSDCTLYVETEPATTMSFSGVTLIFKDKSYKFETENVQYTFAKMDYNDTYFKEGTDVNYGYVTVGTDCYVDLETFDDASNWFDLMQDWGATSINCHGQRMENVVVKIDTSLSNVNFGTVTYNADLNANINVGNIDGIVFDSLYKSVTLKDVKIGGNSVATSITCYKLSAQNVSIDYASASISATTVNIDRSQIGCSLTCKVFEASHSDFVYPITVRTFTAEYCTFLGNINVGYYMTGLNVVCVNNTIGANAVMNITTEEGWEPTEGSTYLATGCQWTGNHILNSNFWIVLDRTWLDPDDRKHSYIYANNTGKCRQPEDPVTYSIPVSRDNNFVSGTPWMHFKVKTDDTAHGGILDMHNGSPYNNIMLFTIGTTDVGANLNMELLGLHVSGTVKGDDDKDEYYNYIANAGVPNTVKCISTSDTLNYTDESKNYFPTLEWVSGYIWKYNCGYFSREFAYDPYEIFHFIDIQFSMDSVCAMNLNLFFMLQASQTGSEGNLQSYVQVKATKF